MRRLTFATARHTTRAGAAAHGERRRSETGAAEVQRGVPLGVLATCQMCAKRSAAVQTSLGVNAAKPPLLA